MLNKNDLILLLTEIQDKGEDSSVMLKKLMSSSDIPVDVIQFINDKKELEVIKFYTHIRKQYNDKKSKLYKNIVDDIKNPSDVLTTLSSLNLQVLLYSKKLSNPELFFSHVRAEELTRVLNNYYKTYDLTSCLKLLKLYRADIIALEAIQHRR